LFPHPHASEVNLKKVLSLFDRVTLFQPWFLEKAPPLAKEWPNLVEVEDPGDELRPKQDFKRLLAEYSQWMRNNYRHGLASFPAFSLDDSEVDFPTWEIKRMIRDRGISRGKDEAQKVLKWHLALHLAEEMEQAQENAADLIKSVEELGSPLKGAIEEDTVPGLIGDLSGPEKGDIFSEERLRQIIEAWFALFGEKARGGKALITLNPQVMKFVTETWDEHGTGGQGERRLHFELESPDLSPLGKQEFLEKRGTFFIRDKRRESVADFICNPGTKFHASDSDRKPENYPGSLRWTFTYFPPLGDKKIAGRWGFIKKLSGKTVGFMEKVKTSER